MEQNQNTLQNFTEEKSLNVIEAARQAIKVAKDAIKAAEALRPFVNHSYDREALSTEAHDFSRTIYGIVGGALYFPLEDTEEPIEALLQKAEDLLIGREI